MASGHALLDHRALREGVTAHGLGDDGFVDCLRSLAAQRLVDMHLIEPSLVTLLRLTDAGVRSHLRASRDDLPTVRHRVFTLLGRTDPDGQPVDMAAALGEPSLVVQVILEDLRKEGRVVFSLAPGHRFRVHRFAG